MFVIVQLLYGIQRRGKGKENDRASIILTYTISVQVEDITVCIESY
jgi:hypothetical protein